MSVFRREDSRSCLAGCLAGVLVTVVLGIGLFFFLTHPPEAPSTTYRPTIIGIIEAYVADTGTIVLATGETLAQADVRSLSGGQRGQGLIGVEGDLLLAGPEEGGIWYQRADAAGSPDCPFVMSSSVWNVGGELVLASGLRLEAATGLSTRLDPGESSASEPFPILCLNRQGRVVKFDG